MEPKSSAVSTRSCGTLRVISWVPLTDALVFRRPLQPVADALFRPRVAERRVRIEFEPRRPLLRLLQGIHVRKDLFGRRRNPHRPDHADLARQKVGSREKDDGKHADSEESGFQEFHGLIPRWPPNSRGGGKRRPAARSGIHCYPEAWSRAIFRPGETAPGGRPESGRGIPPERRRFPGPWFRLCPAARFGRDAEGSTMGARECRNSAGSGRIRCSGG